MKKHINKILLLILAPMTMIHTTACSTPVADTTDAPRRVVVAHRGGAALGMENSLSCIEKGIAAGADMVEIDIHLTADGELVVCHDNTVNRTTDGRGHISHMTLAELKQLHLKDADGNPSDETLPTLEEVLQQVKGCCGLLIEIKGEGKNYEPLVQKLDEVLMRYGMVDEVVVQSFDKGALAEMHRRQPSMRMELLFFIPPIHPERYSYVASINVCHHFTGRRAVARIHASGKEVKLWTVDKCSGAARLPVDGIITNNPTLFTE